MLITNATFVTWDSEQRILSDHGLYIEDGLIREIAPSKAIIERHPDVMRLDARGQLVMPGNLCAHTHFYGAYARGMAIPGEPARDFPEILRRLWWPLDKALDRDAVRASALVCLVDAIKHGTTTLFDHHASPNCIDGSLDVIAEAVDQAGVRAVLCYEVSDRDGVEKAEAGIAENVRFIHKTLAEPEAHPRVRALFGLHASMTLSDETLRWCVDANDRVRNQAAALGNDDHRDEECGGFHIHVAEHEADQDDSLRKYGRRVIERLNDHAILPGTLLAHCVHVTDDEIDLINRAGAWISHQPRSNMNNAVGAMAFDRMVGRGVNVCLGNDGFSNNMWEDWKAAYLLHKVVNRDPRRANGWDIARAGVYTNRMLADFAAPVGVIQEGAAADLIFVDYHPYTPLTSGNLPWHILFGFEASMVTTTIVDGQVLMQDRQLLTLDERAIAAEALALAPGVWERYQKHAQAALNG